MDDEGDARVSLLIEDEETESEVQYPIVISSSLTILNLGKIEYERPEFHSKTNLFPIGYKSVRQHTSMINIKDRCEYICEILDKGNKPSFKITCMDDPENPIEKDSATAAWMFIQIQIQAKKKDNTNAALSGPNHFGLSMKKVQ